MDISRNIEATSKEIEISGVISVKAGDVLIHSSAHGYSNRADEITHTTELGSVLLPVVNCLPRQPFAS